MSRVEYSYCRSDGTRRKAVECDNNGQFTSICADDKGNLFTCNGTCPKSANNEGIWECDATQPLISCNDNKKQQIFIESCDPSWGIWKPKKQTFYSECGVNCGQEQLFYTCSSNECGINPNKAQEWLVDIPCTTNNSIIACPSGSDNTYIVNNTGFILFVRAFLEGTDIAGGQGIPSKSLTYFIVQPKVTLTIPPCCTSVEHRTIQINKIGELTNPVFFQSDIVNSFIPGVAVRQDQTSFCMQYTLTNPTADKECKLQNLKFPQRIKKDTTFTNFGEYLLNNNIQNVLNGATFILQNKLLQFFEVASDTNATGFRTTLQEYEYVFVSLDRQFFQLKGLNGFIKAKMGSKIETDWFQLIQIEPVYDDDLQSGYSFYITFFPYDTNTNQIFNNQSLPIKENEINNGIDRAKVILKSLNSAQANQFLDSNWKEAKRCCSTSEGCPEAGTNPLCKISKYNATNKRASQECENFMANIWCNSSENKTKPECGCIPQASDALENILADALEQNSGIPQARICLVPTCKKNGCIYVPNNLRNAECNSICSQIQDAITNEKLVNIDFQGKQYLKCGLEGKFLNLTKDGANEFDETKKVTNATASVVYGLLLVVLVIVAIIVSVLSWKR